MPTTEPEPVRPPEPAPHRARQVAESFGVDAERYDRARPHYPDALVARIVAAAGKGGNVLDVGCGTGIVARQLKAAGCRVLGVEPDARMADFARRGGVEVEVATFEAWGAADRQFDAVVAGTAWHWVDPVAGPAKAAQVLRPGGRLTVFGHSFELPPNVAAAMTETYRRVVPDAPFNSERRPMLEIYQQMYARATDGIREAGGFDEPQQWRFDWTKSYTRQEWLDQLPTTGMMTRLSQDKLTEVVDGVGMAIDAIGGSFTMPYTTLAVSAARRR